MNDIPEIDPLAENTAKEQRRGRPFEPGQSGNPGGRPKGSRNKITLLAEALLAEAGEGIISNVIEKAKQGDPLSQRLCFDRLVPKRERPITFELPPINTREDARNASASVVAACAAGDLSPDEASKILDVIWKHVRNVVGEDVNKRIEELEKKSLEL